MDDNRYALIATRVWDGVSDRAQEGLAVLIEGARIEAIVPSDQVPRDLQLLRFVQGSVLLPGLIDAHVHYSPWMGPAFLAAGVTTIRDVGNDVDWVLAQQEQNRTHPLSGPEMVCCGALLDGPKPYWHYIGRGHTDPDALRQSIREQAHRGLRSIKFYDGLSQEFIDAGAREAREQGLWILADFGTDDPKAEDAVRAGVNEIEHLTGCPAAWHKTPQAEQDRLIDVLLEYEVVLTPTLITYDHLGRALDLPFRFDSRRIWVHPTYLDIWRRVPRVRMEERREQRQGFQEAAVNQKRFVGRLHQRGATVALGTDTPFQFIIPGFSVHDELSMLVDAGLPAVDALRSATSVNAAILGLQERVGQIRPGFEANLLVVASNPLEDIQSIAEVECVVRGGLILAPDKLRQLSATECSQDLSDPITRDLLRYLASVQAAPSPSA